jgi:hypothetical protein
MKAAKEGIGLEVAVEEPGNLLAKGADQQVEVEPVLPLIALAGPKFREKTPFVEFKAYEATLEGVPRMS